MSTQVKGVMFTNVVHRVDAAADARAALEFQWTEAKRIGIPSTSLFTYPALFEPEAVAQAERLAGTDDELGLHLHEIVSPRTLEKYRVNERMLWLWPREQRIALIDEMVSVFFDRFGTPPASIGAYIMDAWTLSEIEKRHPAVKTAITSCFEEGVKMFYGNYRNWLLFSDGGPWNPFFPSRANALAPARDAREAIDIVAVPHLNRDMIMALSSRDDWFASHPGNLFRAQINRDAECPYLFRFIEAWERQAALNGWSYLNVFVSCPWLIDSHWCIDREGEVRELYSAMLRDLKAREEAGANRNLTMKDFGAAFREIVHPGDATICHWRDEIQQSKREIIWSVNAHHRCAFDMARGGALVDFRPYDGRLDNNLGPETELLWNGCAPFLISTEHCGGYRNTSLHAILSDGSKTIQLSDCRTQVTVRQEPGEEWSIRSRPMKYELGSDRLVIETEWRIGRTSRITIRRKLLEYTGDPSSLVLSEVFAARVGTTEYPEDQRGALLRASSVLLPVTYSGNSVVQEIAEWVETDIPRVGACVRLTAQTDALLGKLTDATIFMPSFRIQLDFRFLKETAICLETQPLKNA